jgi:hypothetical protein
LTAGTAELTAAAFGLSRGISRFLLLVHVRAGAKHQSAEREYLHRRRILYDTRDHPIMLHKRSEGLEIRHIHTLLSEPSRTRQGLAPSHKPRYAAGIDLICLSKRTNYFGLGRLTDEMVSEQLFSQPGLHPN